MLQIHKILLEKISSHQRLIDDWFAAEFLKNKPLFYNSVDLRHSIFKIAPIDNNCFPAGFNNLGEEARKLAKKAVLDFLQKNYPHAKKILLIPENHTRNNRYLQNVLALKNTLEIDGKIEVVIGSLIANLEDKLEMIIDEQKHIITLTPLQRHEDKIITKTGFIADLIITNNDFTHEPEAILHNIKQDIIPSPLLGWHNRTKSKHFDIYQNLANKLADLIKIDPWLISTIHYKCSNIDFKHRGNTENLAKIVDQVITLVKEKYQQYQIKDEPYCYIKADSGTYGMGIMTVKSGEEILSINKKQRNKMNVTKGHMVNHQVIIQEGVPTYDKIDNSVAEPLIYLINGQVVGNLARINDHRDQNNNLNSEGMRFVDLANIEESNLEIGTPRAEMIKIYNLIARLSALGAAIELSLKIK